MPRKITYPRPWNSTGHGSYRELRAGIFEMLWRPAGHTGPKHRRRLPCTEQEAQSFLLDRFEERSRTAAGMPISITWADALQRFQERLEARQNNPRYTEESLALLRSLRDRVRVDPPLVQPIHVDDWLEMLANTARKKKRPGWATTANRKRAQVHAFFRWLFKKRFITANPVDATDPFRAEKRLPRNLTPVEYVKVWEKCEPPLQDLLDFLLLTGCRIGEAVNMKRVDVINGTWIVKKRKGKNDHKIPLPALLLEIILRQPSQPPPPHAADGLVWHKMVRPQPDSAQQGGRPLDTSDPIDAFWLGKVLKYRCKWADVEYFHAHDLRHAAGSWADEEGMAANQIQKLLGHTQLSTTLRYAHGDGTVGAKRVQEMLLTVRAKHMQTKPAKEV